MRTVSEKVEKLLAALREEVAAVDEFNRSDQAQIIRLQNQIVDRSKQGAVTAGILRDVENRVGAEVAREPTQEEVDGDLNERTIIKAINQIKSREVEKVTVELPLPPPPLQTAKDRVIATLRDAGRPMKGKEISEILKDIPERTVTATLSYLKGDGVTLHDPQAATYALNPSP